MARPIMIRVIFPHTALLVPFVLICKNRFKKLRTFFLIDVKMRPHCSCLIDSILYGYIRDAMVIFIANENKIKISCGIYSSYACCYFSVIDVMRAKMLAVYIWLIFHFFNNLRHCVPNNAFNLINHPYTCFCFL